MRFSERINGKYMTNVNIKLSLDGYDLFLAGISLTFLDEEITKEKLYNRLKSLILSGQSKGNDDGWAYENLCDISIAENKTTKEVAERIIKKICDLYPGVPLRTKEVDRFISGLIKPEN